MAKYILKGHRGRTENAYNRIKEISRALITSCLDRPSTHPEDFRIEFSIHRVRQRDIERIAEAYSVELYKAI